MPCSQFRYRTTSPRQPLITWRRVAAEAGAFVEMDAKPTFGGLNLLERFLIRVELFLGEKSILFFETLGRLLGTSVCAESHKSDRENRNQFEKFIDHFFLQLNQVGPPTSRGNESQSIAANTIAWSGRTCHVFSLLSGTEFETRLAPRHVGVAGLYAHSAEKQHLYGYSRHLPSCSSYTSSLIPVPVGPYWVNRSGCTAVCID